MDSSEMVSHAMDTLASSITISYSNAISAFFLAFGKILWTFAPLIFLGLLSYIVPILINRLGDTPDYVPLALADDLGIEGGLGDDDMESIREIMLSARRNRAAYIEGELRNRIHDNQDVVDIEGLSSYTLEDIGLRRL